MLTKSQIIVLHTIKHGDSGIVVQCYSSLYGRQALYYKAPKKGNNLALLHKLNILDVVTYHSTGSSMPTIKEISAPFGLQTLRSDIYKSTISMFLSELLYKCVKETEPNSVLYSFISSSVQILEHTSSGISNFHIHFITHLCKILGYMPLDNYSPQTPVFDLISAKFIPSVGIMKGENRVLDKEESLLLHVIMNTPSTNLETLKYNNTPLPVSGEIRLNFAKHIIEYLSFHLGNNIDIKSLDVLHQVFA